MPARSQCCLWISILCSIPIAAQESEPWTKAVERLIASGNLPAARARLSEEQARRGQTYPVLLLRARWLFAARRFSESFQTLEHCVSMRQDDPEAYKLMGLSAARMERFPAAESALQTAARLAPSGPAAHFHLGALYYTESLFQAALPELERAVTLDGNFLPALIFLGLTQEELGREMPAIETYRQAVRLNALRQLRSELPCLYLGRLLYRLGRVPEAVAFLQQAAATNPRSSEAWLLLGKARSATGEKDKATEAFQNCVQADPRNPEPHYHLSRAYRSQGREQAAQQEMALFRRLQAEARPENDGRRRMDAGSGLLLEQQR